MTATSGIPVLQSNIIGSLTYDTNNNILSGKVAHRTLLSSNETLVTPSRIGKKFRSPCVVMRRATKAISYATTESFPRDKKEVTLLFWA